MRGSGLSPFWTLTGEGLGNTGRTADPASFTLRARRDSARRDESRKPPVAPPLPRIGHIGLQP